MSLLDREEYIEQAYLFRTLKERIQQGMAAQDLLASIREEILSTTKLPMAVDFMAAELRHLGGFASAMRKLGHYFAPFQAFVVGEAEAERGKFDLLLALEILEREARYRADSPPPQGLFLFHFESICRNRLGYDRGLQSVAEDPIFGAGWREWIITVRRQVGLVDFAEMIYVRSQHYVQQQLRFDLEPPGPDKAILFGEKEGKIALANRRKDPLLLFAALHRQLGYPEVPRHRPLDETPQILPTLLRRVERIEARLKLVEEEQKGGIDLTKFYGHQIPPAEYNLDEE
jgi:hypothetical protein